MTKEAVTTSRGLAIVLNLRRRPDRRAWMQESCLKCLQDQLGVPVQILDAVDGRCLSVSPEEGTVHCPHSGDDHNDEIGGGRFHIFPGWKLGFEGICSMHTDWMMRLRYEPITAEEIERFYGRDLLAGEIGCFLSHLNAWKQASAILIGGENNPKKKDFVLILEDDSCPAKAFQSEQRVESQKDLNEMWQQIWTELEVTVSNLAKNGISWDVFYLGRNRFGCDDTKLPLHHPPPPPHDLPQQDVVAAGGEQLQGVVKVGFSSCLHAYAVSSSGVAKLLNEKLQSIIMPVDDLVPALYAQHPRKDIRDLLHKIAAPHIVALGFARNRINQLESVVRGDEKVIADCLSTRTDECSSEIKKLHNVIEKGNNDEVEQGRKKSGTIAHNLQCRSSRNSSSTTTTTTTTTTTSTTTTTTMWPAKASESDLFSCPSPVINNLAATVRKTNGRSIHRHNGAQSYLLLPRRLWLRIHAFLPCQDQYRLCTASRFMTGLYSDENLWRDRYMEIRINLFLSSASSSSSSSSSSPSPEGLSSINVQYPGSWKLACLQLEQHYHYQDIVEDDDCVKISSGNVSSIKSRIRCNSWRIGRNYKKQQQANKNNDEYRGGTIAVMPREMIKTRRKRQRKGEIMTTTSTTVKKKKKLSSSFDRQEPTTSATTTTTTTTTTTVSSDHHLPNQRSANDQRKLTPSLFSIIHKEDNNDNMTMAMGSCSANSSTTTPYTILRAAREKLSCWCIGKGSYENEVVVTGAKAAAAENVVPSHVQQDSNDNEECWRVFASKLKNIGFAHVAVEEGSSISHGTFVRKYDRPRNPVLIRWQHHPDAFHCDNDADNTNNSGGDSDCTSKYSNLSIFSGGDSVWSFQALEHILISAHNNSNNKSSTSTRPQDTVRQVNVQMPPPPPPLPPPITTTMALSTYLSVYMRRCKDADPLYLFEHDLPQELVAKINVPNELFFGGEGGDILERIAKEKKEEEEEEEKLNQKTLTGRENNVSGTSSSSYCAISERQWLVIGPAGSGSRFHVDPHATSAWNALYQGTKLWAFFCEGGQGQGQGETFSGSKKCKETATTNNEVPPLVDIVRNYDDPRSSTSSSSNGDIKESNSRPLLYAAPSAEEWFVKYFWKRIEMMKNKKTKKGQKYKHANDLMAQKKKDEEEEEGEGSFLEEEKRRMETTISTSNKRNNLVFGLQRPGDIVFVPHGCWHCVLNLEPSIAFTQNFINRQNLKAATQHARKYAPANFYQKLRSFSSRKFSD